MGFPEIGEKVAHFQILERLGKGGMGVVYKARDLRLGRLAALKFMASEDEARDAAARRFLREAQAASALDHPNVCTLYEIGETACGQTFLAMAFCDGETLRRRLRSGPLDPQEAVDIAIQVADGLAAAHARGIIHRDIHPGNILLSSGIVKIVDFGVARLADPERTRLTRDGVAVGTLPYSSPEQLCGEEVGPEADLWSLGVVLYETLAGRLPFLGRSVPALIHAILEGEPPPLQGVSREIERVILKALSKEPEHRHPSAAALQEDLRLALADELPTWDAHPIPVRNGPPPLHNLPFPPLGELFKGRSKELQLLEEALEKGGPNVIHGLGGIGKTRLAIEHAWRRGHRYPAVLFVLADSPEGLSSGLAALARRDLLDLPEREAPAEGEVVGAVMRWLRDNPRWLLILDSVDTKESQLAVIRLLPALAGGRVLITSRRRDWPACVQRHPIDLIPVEAAQEFLLQRTAEDRRQEPGDEEQALRLGELLDGLPLALEQAASYIVHTQISLAEYLDIWESECDSVLAWYDEGVMQYPASLAVTWQRTFRQLSPTAQALLRLIAQLAPDPIPVEMLESGAQLIQEAMPGPEMTPRPIREDLAELTALSLISRQGALITVHRLVQEVIRHRVPAERQTAWLDLALEIVAHFGPGQADDANTWTIWDPLRPHALQVLTRARDLGLEDSHTQSLLATALSLYLCARSLYKEAEPLMRSVLELDERLFGRESRAIATCLLNLGELLRRTARAEEAEPLLRRSLELFSAQCGESSPEACKALNCLALILMDRRCWSEAEGMLREALVKDQTREERTGSSVTRDLHNLALLLASTGRNREAEPLIRRSLEISLKVHGEDNPWTARKMQILATVLRDLGRTDEAEPLARRTLDAFERVLGPDHPRTQSARKDLATLTDSPHPPRARGREIPG